MSEIIKCNKCGEIIRRYEDDDSNEWIILAICLKCYEERCKETPVYGIEREEDDD